MVQGGSLKVQFYLFILDGDIGKNLDDDGGKGFQLTSVCLFCYKSGESICHLLLRWPFAWRYGVGFFVTSGYGSKFLRFLLYH